MSENLAKVLTEAAEANPDGVAIKLDDIELSYAALDGASATWPGCSRPRASSLATA